MKERLYSFGGGLILAIASLWLLAPWHRLAAHILIFQIFPKTPDSLRPYLWLVSAVYYISLWLVASLLVQLTMNAIKVNAAKTRVIK